MISFFQKISPFAAALIVFEFTANAAIPSNDSNSKPYATKDSAISKPYPSKDVTLKDLAHQTFPSFDSNSFPKQGTYHGSQDAMKIVPIYKSQDSYQTQDGYDGMINCVHDVLRIVHKALDDVALPVQFQQHDVANAILTKELNKIGNLVGQSIHGNIPTKLAVDRSIEINEIVTQEIRDSHAANADVTINSVLLRLFEFIESTARDLDLDLYLPYRFEPRNRAENQDSIVSRDAYRSQDAYSSHDAWTSQDSADTNWTSRTKRFFKKSSVNSAIFTFVINELKIPYELTAIDENTSTVWPLGYSRAFFGTLYLMADSAVKDLNRTLYAAPLHDVIEGLGDLRDGAESRQIDAFRNSFQGLRAVLIQLEEEKKSLSINHEDPRDLPPAGPQEDQDHE